MHAHIITYTTRDDQSAPEHLSIPKIEGFFFEPLKRLMKRSTKNIPMFVPYFLHYLWPFSNSMILLVRSMFFWMVPSEISASFSYFFDSEYSKICSLV